MRWCGYAALRDSKVPSEAPERFPLSFPQLRIWRLKDREPEAHNIALVCKVPPLDLTAFSGAVRDLVTRHATLRTLFLEADGIPYQSVAGPGEIDPAPIVSAADPDTIEAQIRKDERIPFVLGSEAPIRVHVYCTAGEATTVLILVHNIVIDAWAVRTMVGDLTRAYMARRAGAMVQWRPLAIQYGEYAKRQREQSDERQGDRLSSQREFWRTTLRELPFPPTSQCLPAAGNLSGTVKIAIDPGVHACLLAAGEADGATLFDILHAGTRVLADGVQLHQDLLIGTMVSGRTTRELGNVVGLFENPLVLWTPTKSVRTFRQLLTLVQLTDAHAFANEELPFENIRDDFAQGVFTGRWPFKLFLTLQDGRDLTGGMPGLTASIRPGSGVLAGDCGMRLDLIEWRTQEGEPNGIEGTLEWSGSQLNRELAERRGAQFVRLLEAVASDAGVMIADITEECNKHPKYPTGRIFRPKNASYTDEDQANRQRRLANSFGLPNDIIQDRLASIWEEAINVKPVGIYDQFSELGGTAETAGVIFERLEQQCNIKLATTMITGNTTIQELSEAIVECLKPIQLILIRPGSSNTRCPLFYLPGDITGGGLYAFELVRTLPSDLPFYALQQHGLNGQMVPESIEEMAADHIRTIRSLRPGGPYALGGYCTGSLVALEIARQLLSQGEGVNDLIMVEAPQIPHGSPDNRGHPRKPPAGWMNSARTRRVWLFDQYVVAARRYRVTPYAGRVGFFYAEERPMRRRDPDWPFPLDRYPIHTLPGNHISCIGRHVLSTGHSIATYLEES